MVRFAVFSLACALALSVWIIWPKAGSAVTTGVAAPDFKGEHWINSNPLIVSQLKGQVVLLEFWTYG